MSSLSIHPLIQLKIHHQFRAKKPRKSIVYASSDNPQSQRQQQLNLSVLRFTFGRGKKIKNLSFWFFIIIYSALSLELFDKNFSSPQGIPGLDESYLPRWIGYGFGSLLILNHFLGSNPDTTQAQLVIKDLFFVEL